MKKKVKIKKKKLIIIIIAILILILGICCYIFLLKNDNEKNTTIIAIKTIIENDSKQEIKYIITIENYDVKSIQENITYQTKEKAEENHIRYQALKEYVRGDIEVSLNGKVVIMDLPLDYFLEELQYDETNNILYISKEGEQKNIVDIQIIKQLLQEQGYTIK